MTAERWVRQARLRLALLGGARAVAWAGVVVFLGLALGTVLASGPMRAAAVGAGAVALITLLWRERFVWSSKRVALWIEERVPELRYALVTALDPRYAGTMGPRIDPLLARIDRDPLLRRSGVRFVALPVLAFALAAAAFALAPTGSFARGAGPVGGGGDDVEPAPSRLIGLEAHVTPPAYALAAGIQPATLDDPTMIRGLAGSSVRVTGPGEPDGVAAAVADASLEVSGGAGDASSWEVRFTLPDSAAALRLDDRAYRRHIVLAPVHDRPPAAQLVLPAIDTTVREARGSLTLDARLTDAIGLSRGRFEYIVVGGEGEGNFTAREGVLGARRFDEPGLNQARLRLTVPLDTFRLQPGDQLSVRAVVLDNNDWSGPGVGYSESRMLRVARPGEYDSLAVEGAPPPDDSTLMTLRYLIKLTEDLDDSRADLDRPVFVDSSRGLGTRAQRLRARVQSLQADQTMGGLFAPNPLLDTAYIELVQGESALKVAEPGESLPHLWAAYRVLEKWAFAERYYVRGRGPETLVDLSRVRLTGTETGRASERPPRAAADTARAHMRKAYTDAVRLLDVAPDSALERLTLLQVDALRREPRLAAYLGAAVAAIQAGRDPGPALEGARRILDGPLAVTDTLPRWSGAW